MKGVSYYFNLPLYLNGLLNRVVKRVIGVTCGFDPLQGFYSSFSTSRGSDVPVAQMDRATDF